MRLAERLSQVSERTDPVQHLAELGVAHTKNALAHRATAAFLPLVDATRRA